MLIFFYRFDSFLLEMASVGGDQLLALDFVLFCSHLGFFFFLEHQIEVSQVHLKGKVNFLDTRCSFLYAILFRDELLL